jgi:hypothetical protein
MVGRPAGCAGKGGQCDQSILLVAPSAAVQLPPEVHEPVGEEGGRIAAPSAAAAAWVASGRAA